MSSFPFTTAGDFLVARAHQEVVRAEIIMQRSLEANDYFYEKAAAKILAFYEMEHKLIAHYVELKLYFPESATALEAQKPYLGRIWSEAENELVQLRQESERS